VHVLLGAKKQRTSGHGGGDDGGDGRAGDLVYSTEAEGYGEDIEFGRSLPEGWDLVSQKNNTNTEQAYESDKGGEGEGWKKNKTQTKEKKNTKKKKNAQKKKTNTAWKKTEKTTQKATNAKKKMNR
jgi:hypothetical protein